VTRFEALTAHPSRWGAAVALSAVALSMVGCSSSEASIEPSTASNAQSNDDEASVSATSRAPGDIGADEEEEASSSQTIPGDGQPAELGPLGSTDIELETEGGAVQIGSGEIPALVSSDFPVPDDFIVQLSSETGTDAGFSGITQMAFDELVDFYTVGLAGVGYAVTQDQLVADTVAVLGFEGPDGSGKVAISIAPGGAGRNVIVTYER
jgi:hypothetical protein